MDDFKDLSNEVNQEREIVSSDDVSDEVLEILLNTREQGQMMEKLIKNQIEVKDNMINKLYDELNYYKNNTSDRFINQLMKSVIKVRKDMIKFVKSERWQESSMEDLQREYQYVLDDLTDLLEQQNVDSYSTSSGEQFDASIHQPRVEATDDKMLDKRIKKSLSEGYKKGDKVLIPERVIVYQFKEKEGN